MEGIILLFTISIIIIFMKEIFKSKQKKGYKKTNYTNYKNKKQKTNYKDYKKTMRTIKAKDIATHFNISQQQVHKIINILKFSIKAEKRGWSVTELGIGQGAIQKYFKGTAYIEWEEKILKNQELINVIQNSKNSKETVTKKSYKMNNQEKKEKGDKYEEYIAKFFREQGYFVWEHGKEKGVEDSSIDLFIKKDKFVYFVQCKNWDKWKINHKEVKATRTDVRDYLNKKKEFWELIKDYQTKILYVTPKECLERSAYTYIKENKDIVEYQVIPMNS